MLPIFIFSLPRSGSTLLQKIISTSEMIQTTDEPWFLLPLIYMNKQYGLTAEYSHYTSSLACDDFFNKIGESKLRMIQRTFADHLYKASTSSDMKYFIDKTPRYYLIIDDIIKIYPDAKFVFLFRNPIAIFSSILSTWGNGKLFYAKNFIDLYEGPKKLIEGYNRYKDRSVFVSYEKLLMDSDAELKKITEYLEIDVKDININKIGKNKLNGIVGDYKGRHENNIISENINLYKENINNSYRRKVIEKYIKENIQNIYEEVGYSYEYLVDEIEMINVKRGIYFKDRFWNYMSIHSQKYDFFWNYYRKNKFSKISKKERYIFL